MAEMLICAVCGRETPRKAKAQKYCPDCARVVAQKNNRERANVRYERLKEERQAESRPQAPLPKKNYGFLTPSVAPEGWSLAGKSADQVTAEARALGLSYGQYSSYVNSGMIEHYCRTIGIDGLEVTKKAWAEFKRHQKKLRTGKAS